MFYGDPFRDLLHSIYIGSKTYLAPADAGIAMKLASSSAASFKRPTATPRTPSTMRLPRSGVPACAATASRRTSTKRRSALSDASPVDTQSAASTPSRGSAHAPGLARPTLEQPHSDTPSGCSERQPLRKLEIR
ncbi:hypothetical protein BV25DRAFT_1917818 [Artomyces pyxidatus]|uniref:Uncharacterized protein n=1 Tax=Artomyces pyxidatus TaxID=48021 RepID=A0ACB8SWC4_9AGAM|nr:hypothetical protein BV25DRAFT_1917818 [Artomyces pyxidatus]